MARAAYVYSASRRAGEARRCAELEKVRGTQTYGERGGAHCGELTGGGSGVLRRRSQDRLAGRRASVVLNFPRRPAATFLLLFLPSLRFSVLSSPLLSVPPPRRCLLRRPLRVRAITPAGVPTTSMESTPGLDDPRAHTPAGAMGYAPTPSSSAIQNGQPADHPTPGAGAPSASGQQKFSNGPCVLGPSPCPSIAVTAPTDISVPASP